MKRHITNCVSHIRHELKNPRLPAQKMVDAHCDKDHRESLLSVVLTFISSCP